MQKTESILIHEFEKNATQMIRIHHSEQHGHKLVDIRIWVESEGGLLIPTKEGVAFRRDLISDMREGILKSEELILHDQRRTGKET